MYVEARSISPENITRIDNCFVVPFTRILFTNVLFCLLAILFYIHNSLIIRHLPPLAAAIFVPNI